MLRIQELVQCCHSVVTRWPMSVYEKEYLAILLAVQQWRQYLQLGEFLIRTDHKSLTHLTDQRLHTDWQQKALTKMMGLQFKVVYKKRDSQWRG